MAAQPTGDHGVRSGHNPVELLQQLGLKEYEAKCFVTLTRVPEVTAKDISEHSWLAPQLNSRTFAPYANVSRNNRLQHCNRGGSRTRPLRFAENDAEKDALHCSQHISTTMCHRQGGVNLVWWCRRNGGSPNPRDYNTIISALRFVPRWLRGLASTPLDQDGRT